MKRKLGIGTAVALLALALTVTVTACGGDSDSDSVASLDDTPSESATEGEQDSGDGGSAGDEEQERREAQLAFAQCMREHGIDFPDPVNGRFEFRGERGDEQKMQEAQEACRDILEAVAPPPLDEEEQAELREALLEFAQCMREHGIDMPDPQFEEGGGTLQVMPEGAEDDPDLEEAQDACQPILDEAQRRPPVEGGEA